MFSGLSRQGLRRRAYGFSTALKPRHKARFRTLTPEKARALSEYSAKTYPRAGDDSDFDAALADTLLEDRCANVPWLDSILPLDGATILEIGGGTGESTLALAEQGARLTVLDIDEKALLVGEARLKAHGLEAEFKTGNAVDLASLFAGRSFDMIIFFASLEHMTLEERLTSMRASFDLLRSGGVFVVIEAPNRLWYYDGHTSMENFYNWLPDDVAFRWASRSGRKIFADDVPEGKAFDPVHLARWGRGVSFHDFDLAFGDSGKLDVISNKSDFQRRTNPLFFAHALVSKARRYERFLESIAPEVDKGFLRQYLDIAIRKA